MIKSKLNIKIMIILYSISIYINQKTKKMFIFIKKIEFYLEVSKKHFTFAPQLRKRNIFLI